ncbi:MAG: hypothetical protein HFH59_08595 [Lachnospiraceae bacterium]|nr:hypothetical protein [Lachnospiraceae bacterium]
MQFYIIEWIVLTLLIAPSKRHSNGEKLRRYIGGLIYVFFAAFRDVTTDRGLDAYAYYTIFERAKLSFKNFLLVSNVELGYSFVAWIIKNIFNSYTIFLIFVHLFVYCAYIFFIDNIPLGKNRILLSAVLCLDLFSVYYLQRNIIAVGIALIMYVQLFRNKKKLKTIILMLTLAITFHYSAVILIPICCIEFLTDQKNKLSKHKIIIIEAMAIIFTIIGSSFLNSFMSGSSKYYVYQNIGSFAVATNIVAIFVAILYLKNFRLLNDSFPVTRVMGIILLSIFLIIPLQIQYSIMYRMILFFLPIMSVMIMYIVEIYRGTRWQYAFQLFMLTYYIYRIVSFFVKEAVYIGVPYKMVI